MVPEHVLSSQVFVTVVSLLVKKSISMKLWLPMTINIHLVLMLYMNHTMIFIGYIYMHRTRAFAQCDHVPLETL